MSIICLGLRAVAFGCVCVERQWLGRVVKVRSSVLLVVFVCPCACGHGRGSFRMDRALGVSRWYLGDQ